MSSGNAGRRSRLGIYASLARPDHWVKNIFVLPGVVLPFSVLPVSVDQALVWRLVLGTIAVCLIASSNYVINEILDAPYDRLHPVKRARPIPSGLVTIRIAYAEWVALMVAGMALALMVSSNFATVMAALWGMGCIYNIRPFRSKDIVYLDVLSEAINNPIRMLAGWYMVTDALIPTLSLLLAYWMVGCYFMALKRFSEYRGFTDRKQAIAYRLSFRYYTERSLLTSVMFYAAASMLFLGAFIARYRIELVLAFPLLAFVMAVYLDLAFEAHSAVQHPEKLYRQTLLTSSVAVCVLGMLLLLFIDIPPFQRWFAPLTPLHTGQEGRL